MNNNAWFKKENPFQTVIGYGGGATGFGAHSSIGSPSICMSLLAHANNDDTSTRSNISSLESPLSTSVWTSASAHSL